MTEQEIKKIQKEIQYNEIRMFSIFLQGTKNYKLSTLHITCDDYWVEECPLTVNQFLELIDYGEEG